MRSVKQLVDRGLEIDALIDTLTVEKKEIEAELKTIAANGEQVDLEDAEREGKQFLARGSSGVIVPVVFTADLIVQSFALHSKAHDHIWLAAQKSPAKFESFYEFVCGYESRIENGKLFRRKAAEVFGEAAPKFISACLRRNKEGVPVSQTRVEWDRAKPSASETTFAKQKPEGRATANQSLTANSEETK